jgi:hypothetical protein
MQHCSLFSRFYYTSSLNTYIPTAALGLVALELSTYSVEQTARSKCCAKACGILVSVCYVQPEQGSTYRHHKKKSSHRLRVAMKRFPGPSLSVMGDPWTASDGGFSGEFPRGNTNYIWHLETMDL